MRVRKSEWLKLRSPENTGQLYIRFINSYNRPISVCWTSESLWRWDLIKYYCDTVLQTTSISYRRPTRATRCLPNICRRTAWPSSIERRPSQVLSTWIDRSQQCSLSRRTSNFVELSWQHVVTTLWRSFKNLLSPEFVRKFQKELPLFLEKAEFPFNAV